MSRRKLIIIPLAEDMTRIQTISTDSIRRADAKAAARVGVQADVTTWTLRITGACSRAGAGLEADFVAADVRTCLACVSHELESQSWRDDRTAVTVLGGIALPVGTAKTWGAAGSVCLLDAGQTIVGSICKGVAVRDGVRGAIVGLRALSGIAGVL